MNRSDNLAVQSSSLDSNSSSEIKGRVPPHSIDSEQSLLGAVLVDNDTTNAMMEILLPEDFYFSSHQQLAAAMLTLTTHNKPIDIITLSEELKSSGSLEAVGGLEYISFLNLS